MTVTCDDTTPVVTPATASGTFTGTLVDNVPTVQYSISYDAGTQGAGGVIIAITDAEVTTVHFEGSGTQTGSFAYRCGAATFFLAIEGQDTVSGTPYPVTIPCAVEGGGSDGSTGGTDGGTSPGAGTSMSGTTTLASSGTTTTSTTAAGKLPETGLNSAVTATVAAGSAGLLLLGVLSVLLARRIRRTATR